MWSVLESREAAKALDKLPKQIVEKYEFWMAIVRQSGPMGLRTIRGFHDEALSHEWKGFRSSRLSLQWRVIYKIDAAVVSVCVVRVTPHDYRR